jgi:hypothetical protein
VNGGHGTSVVGRSNAKNMFWLEYYFLKILPLGIVYTM